MNKNHFRPPTRGYNVSPPFPYPPRRDATAIVFDTISKNAFYDDENGGLPVIMHTICLIFCLTGTLIVSATCLEAYMAWYSGVEYIDVSPAKFWGWALIQSSLVVAAVAAVMFSLLRS